MLLIISLGLILLKLIGILKMTWTSLLMIEFLLLVASILELTAFYKILSKKYK